METKAELDRNQSLVIEETMVVHTGPHEVEITSQQIKVVSDGSTHGTMVFYKHDGEFHQMHNVKKVVIELDAEKIPTITVTQYVLR